jgi:ribonuclease E
MPEAAPVAEPVTLSATLEQSGLVMVETSADRVQAWRQPEAPEEQPEALRRRPRGEAVPVPVAAEPLVQIETRK